MRITDQRYLPEDNRYTTQPCLLSILELDPDAQAAPSASFNQRLLAALPGLRGQRGLVGKRTSDADDVPPLVQVVQQVAIELRRLASNEVTLGFIGVVPRTQGRYRLVLPYTMKHAVAPVLDMATRLVDALLAGRPFNLKEGLAQLRAQSERRSALRARS